MNAEPILNQDTVQTEPTHRWADDGGGLTEELRLALRRYRAFIGVILPK